MYSGKKQRTRCLRYLHAARQGRTCSAACLRGVEMVLDSVKSTGQMQGPERACICTCLGQCRHLPRLRIFPTRTKYPFAIYRRYLGRETGVTVSKRHCFDGFSPDRQTQDYQSTDIQTYIDMLMTILDGCKAMWREETLTAITRDPGFCLNMFVHTYVHTPLDSLLRSPAEEANGKQKEGKQQAGVRQQPPSAFHGLAP